MATIKKSATRLARQEKRAARREADKPKGGLTASTFLRGEASKPKSGLTASTKAAGEAGKKSVVASEDNYKVRSTGEGRAAPPDLTSKFVAAPAATKKAEETFGQAFARERKAGAKTFTHNGKSYTTETKEDVAKKTAPVKKAETPAAKPATPATKTYNLKQVVADQTGKRPVGALPSPKAATPVKKTAPTPPANRKGLPPAKCGTKVNAKKK